MGTVIEVRMKPVKKLWHKLFNCPTFWSIKTRFKCPRCKAGYRCYWDGNDVSGHGIDFCDKCARFLEKECSCDGEVKACSNCKNYEK